MHVIILAAGESKRFKEAGYSIRKPWLQIEWRGTQSTMLNHVIDTVPLQFKDQITIAWPPGLNYVMSWPRSYDVGHTKGPAHTTLKMIEQINPDSCLIMDSDILNFTNDLYELTQLEEGCGVLVSSSADPSYSYVDSWLEFKRIAEKKRISEFAVRGAYFVSKQAMPEFVSKLKSIVAEKDEPFISHVFDIMTCKKHSPITSYTPINWGTPHDVELSGAKIVTERKN